MRPSSRSPRKIPAQTRSTVTVEAILEAAVRIFTARGYRAATTARIAQCAGVSVGSLYQYFPNKLALLATLKQRHLRRTLDEIEKTLTASSTLAAGLRAALRVHLAATLAARPLLLMFADELPARLTQPAPSTDAPHVAMLRRFLRRHRAAIIVRDASLAALVVTEMIDAVTRAALQQRPRDLENGVLETELANAALLYLRGRAR